MPARNRAYSLLELLLTLTLASVVIVIGAPALQNLIAKNRQIIEINALSHAVYLARKESIMRHAYISLCPSADGRQCLSSRDWSTGWILFVNADRDHPAQADHGEILLKSHSVHPAIRLTANRQSFTLRATQLRATNGTFVACDIGARTPARALVVSYTGRPRATLRNSRGKPYRCAH